MSVIKIVSLACLYFVLNIVFHHQEPLYLDVVRAAMSRAGQCHDECTRLSEPDSWYTSTALSGWYGSHRDACYTPSEGVLKSEGNHIGTVISILYMAVEPGTFFHELQIAHFLELVSKKVREINQIVLHSFFSNFLCCSFKLLLQPVF